MSILKEIKVNISRQCLTSNKNKFSNLFRNHQTTKHFPERTLTAKDLPNIMNHLRILFSRIVKHMLRQVSKTILTTLYK